MLLNSAPLATIAAELRSGERDLQTYINEVCDRLEQIDGQVHAFLPEAERRARLLHDAEGLQTRFPDPAKRPPLYGVPVGVKDIFHAEGFRTRAGSALPPELFAGAEAAMVSALKAAGALVLGKTVTTEFAYFEPGPTRNPHNLAHTPGGSSSGSAAGVAAGLTPLALGTQTVGSVIRPAAYCGVVGFKPSYGRVDRAGLLLISPSLDHVGLFTQDVAGMRLAASLLCTDWQPAQIENLPVLGVPDGAYLQQASPEGLAAFEGQLARLRAAGYSVERLPALDDIAEIKQQHMRLMAGEMAQIHAAWFVQHETLYRPRTADLLREGQMVDEAALAAARAIQDAVRARLQASMADNGIDLWVSPAAPGPAPTGIDTTGDPAMNLPWTNAGLPTVALPAGVAENGLPLGLQCAGAFMADERVLSWAEGLAGALAGLEAEN